MPRLFVAIELPAAIVEAITGLKTLIPTARWVKPNQMHLTLRFIGADVPESQVEPIKSALATVKAQPFAIDIGGVGRFPPDYKKAPRVLWVGIQPQPALNALHAQIESALETVGFAPETRPFNPHITLARLKSSKPVPQVDHFLSDHDDFHAGAFEANRFILVNSTLTSSGSRYTHAATYELEYTE